MSSFYNELCDLIDSINSTFTLQLGFVMINLLLTDVFSAYGVLREIMSKSTPLKFIITANGTGMLIQYSIRALMAFSGSSTTNEAEKSLVLVNKILANTDSNDPLRADLLILLHQMRYINKKLKNNFFTVNWNVLLVVSSKNKNHFHFKLNCQDLYLRWRQRWPLTLSSFVSLTLHQTLCRLIESSTSWFWK